jgi:hypothetical protein
MAAGTFLVEAREDRCVRIVRRRGDARRILSTSRIGDGLINDVTSAVEWPVPGSAKFKVFGAIDRHSCGSVRDRRHQDTYRWLHNLIALASWLVEAQNCGCPASSL